MSLASEIAFKEDNRYCERLKNKYIQEMKDILGNCNIEWNDDYLVVKDFSPKFNEKEMDSSKWFYILLGKYIAIDDYQNNLNW